jgi:hypothetical protein
MNLPAENLRVNRGTWAVVDHVLPAVGNWLHDVLPNEPYDPHFEGQRLRTTYFDTPGWHLRNARMAKRRYLTLRVREYRQEPAGTIALALSGKTESSKFRTPVSSEAARAILDGDQGALRALLPADLLARLDELTGGEEVRPVVAVRCVRYAVEDQRDRFTLDCAVTADTGKCLPFNVLEYKSADPQGEPYRSLVAGLRPIKLSKFLWATEV